MKTDTKKKILSTMHIASFVIQLLYPVFLIVGKIFSFDFHLNGVAISLLTIILMSSFLIKKSYNDAKFQQIITMLPVIIAINGLLLCFEQNQQTSIFIVSQISIIFCFCYSLFILIKMKSKQVAQKITIAVSVLLVILLTFLSIISAFANEMGSTSIEKSVLSPSGKYLAEVADVSQGALGGDTVVYISKNTKDINILIGKFSTSKEMIYIGAWGKSTTIQIEWADNDTLKIDSAEYNIKK